MQTVSGVGLGEPAQVEARARRLLALALLFTCTSLIPVLLMCYGPSASPQTVCFSEWIAVLYVAPWCRISEFVLGMITATLYIMITEAAAQAEDADGGRLGSSSSALLRFLTQHWLLHSPYVLLVAITGLAVLLVMLGLPAVAMPYMVLVLNPGSFALGFVFLLLLMCNTAAPLSTRLSSRPFAQQFNLVALVLTLPVAVTMGEVSFAFYAFHLSPQIYVGSLGLSWPPSLGLAFVAALGLAVPAHYYVEVPVYQYCSRRLPKCDCSDDHVGLSDIHSDQQQVMIKQTSTSDQQQNSAL